MTQFESVLREALRPRCVLNHHPRGVMQWAWSPVDGWRGDMRLPRRDFIFTPLFSAIFSGVFGFSGAALTTATSIASAIATTAMVPGIQVHL